MVTPTQGQAHADITTINLAGTKTEVAAITIAGKVIAMTATAASPRFEQAKIDAAHLARCWNHHDALVDACREQYAAIDELMRGIKALAPDFDPATHPAWAAAQQAYQVFEDLKAAGG